MSEGSIALLLLLAFLALRILGPAAFGEYLAASAFVGLFRTLPDFGMAYASTLSISRQPEGASRLLGNLLGLQLVLSAATALLCLGVGHALFDGTIWAAIVILTADLVLKAVQTTLRWVLKGFSRFGAEALTLLLERASVLALALVALRRGWGVVGFALVFAAVRLVDTTALWAWIHRRVVPLSPSADRAAWQTLFRRGLPFAWAGAMITLFFQVDTVILERMRGSLEVGWYGAPVRIVEGLTLVPRVLGYALIPAMARFHASAPERVTELFARGTKYLLLVGLPVAAFGVVASERFVLLLFGEAYLPSAAAARLLIPATAFMFLSNFAETTLLCVDRWRPVVVVSTVALVLNVVLNLAWIPAHGYRGASWATLVTEAAYFLLLAGALARAGHRIRWAATLARPVLATAVFTGVLLATAGLPLWASAAAASAVYVVAALGSGALDASERALAAGLARRLLGR